VKRELLVAAILTACACGCAHHSPDRDIRAVLDAQAAAWNRGDIDGFMDGYWNSEELSFSAGGRTKRGWTATRDGYRRRYDTREKMGTLTFSELEITPLGRDAAYVLGRWQITRAAPVGGNFTLIVRRFADGWKVVHDHTSADGD
jgi:ketosteroid isomerase-like protein